MAFDGPRLRRDLVSTISQEDGVRYVDVHDPRRGSSFRLFDYEYSVALAFDGRPLAKVIPWVRLSTGLELTPEQLTSFAERLDQLGFLASDEASTPGVALKEQPALVPHPSAEARHTPLPVSGLLPESPATARTPEPLPEPPATEKSPRPLPEPAPALAEALPATESLPVTAEQAPEPAEAETAATEPLSSAAPPATEPPAAEVTPSQPDSPSQAQPLLPVADATPPPIETPLASSTPVQEPSQVPPETRPSAVADTAPSPPLAKTPPPLPGPRPANRPSAAEATDRTSRPHTVKGGARGSTPGPRRILTPPPLPTPPPPVTPAPSRSTRVRGGPWILYALFGTLAALAVGVLVVPLALDPRPPAAVRARVSFAKPTAVVRWFDATAPVEGLPSQVLSFPAGGKVIRLASPGTSLRPGDVVAATDAARLALADLARQQERLAYRQELVQGIGDMGDELRAGAARTKVELSAGLIERTQRALSRVAVVAQAPNQVEATLATLGQTVRAGTPAVRMRRAGWRASFELPRTLAARVWKQGFCEAEIEGRPVGCDLVSDGGDETHVVIELAPEAATAAGQPARMARARFSDAFLVPAAALSRVGQSDRVLVVAPTGRAEVRNVTVADRTATDAVITQGLDAGDAVIIGTSEPVGAGARVRITKATGE